MAIQIENAQSGDLRRIEEIAKAAYGHLRASVSEDLWKRWIGGIIDSIHSDKATIIVLKRDGKIVGVIQLYEDAAQSELNGLPDGERAGALRVFAVLPEYQGQGYGEMLIDECIERARKLNLSKLYLHTGYINQAAVHLFERIGFKRVPELDFYPYDQTIHLAVAFCLELH